MAEAIGSPLSFFCPHGMGQQYEIGTFGSRYIYVRGDTQEDTPSVGIMRNSKLCFCAHKTEIAHPEEVGRGRNFDRNQEQQKRSFRSRLYARG